MQLRETVDVAFHSIRANWLRASLTMLGIVIGVAAVITMLALGTGARRAIEEKIAALGAQLLTIYPGQTHAHGVASAERVSLTVDEGPHRDRFTVNLVPHTLQWTTFDALRPGRLVNLEMDVLVKAARTGRGFPALDAPAAPESAAPERPLTLSRLRAAGFGRRAPKGRT